MPRKNSLRAAKMAEISTILGSSTNKQKLPDDFIAPTKQWLTSGIKKETERPLHFNHNKKKINF